MAHMMAQLQTSYVFQNKSNECIPSQNFYFDKQKHGVYKESP